MKNLTIDAIEYLGSLAGKVPNTRVGIGYDGQRLGIVCFSLVRDNNREPKERVVKQYIGGMQYNQTVHEPYKAAYVWFADIFEGVGSNTVFRQLDQILTLATDSTASGTEIYARGLPKVAWSFAREAKKNYGVKIFEFEKKSFGRWTPEEVASAVIDDLYEERIVPAPEFRARPEFEILNSVLRNFKLSDEMDPLAEAAFYGFGYWSALQQRPKWHTGGSNFLVY
jgi:hypothetical protein